VQSFKLFHKWNKRITRIFLSLHLMVIC
jgi:hypothetical protein